MLSLPAAGFAWEFARRGHAYQDAWSRHDGADTGADGFGLLRYENPTLDALAAMPLWRPDANRHVLPLTGDRPRGNGRTTLFADLECQVRRLMVGGDEHVLFGDHGRFLQLAVAGGLGNLHAVTLQNRVLTSPCCLALHWRGLRQFADLVRYRALRPKLYPAENRAARFVQMLQVLDLNEGGATKRDIGLAVFGERKVAEEWGHGADRLRDWVRYSLRAAQHLADKGYLKLLR